MKSDFPKIRFTYPYDERLAFEAAARGHLGGIIVELADGSQHPVFFYDPVRLVQDLEEESRLGRPFVAEKGMIIVREVTLDNIVAAVQSLAKSGFFETSQNTSGLGSGQPDGGQPDGVR